MASSTTLSLAIIPSKLCSSRNGVNSASHVAFPKLGNKRMKVSCMATSVPVGDRVPYMGKRQLLNLLLFGAISLPSGGMLFPYTYFFVPPGSVHF